MLFDVEKYFNSLSNNTKIINMINKIKIFIRKLDERKYRFRYFFIFRK